MLCVHVRLHVCVHVCAYECMCVCAGVWVGARARSSVSGMIFLANVCLEYMLRMYRRGVSPRCNFFTFGYSLQIRVEGRAEGNVWI